MSKPIVDQPFYNNESSIASDAASTHTSIGRSIRGPYKSYSEKFLAEQEEEKHLLLMGRAPRLLLTNGPVDPEPTPLLQLTNGEDVLGEDEKSKSTASKKSSVASDTRRGNYSGGVRYFTPDNCKYDEESEEVSQDEEDEEETIEEEEVSAIEINDSDAGSMLSQEEESYYKKNDGVESVQSSTNSEASPTNRQAQGVRMASSEHGNKNISSSRRAPMTNNKKAMRRSSPPDMAPISDDSESSNSWDA